ncbi:zinc finger BED domain-containing protein RICESLEEPER 1-like [Pistacia vera]|uniref:zinc finger BED domain-containing protein RICESLEEPER 1-like n=1 Tax=Pistacia vera TaxID=55513 RepID=UPI001262B554|nr:zinc finger BED domain-containing protein RICESLEEPER 1-like [Pistacia vera]
MEAISIESDPHLYFQVGKIKISEGMKCLLDLVEWYKDNFTPESDGRVNEIMAYLKSLQQQVVQEIESLAQQGEVLVSSNVNGTDLQRGQEITQIREQNVNFGPTLNQEIEMVMNQNIENTSNAKRRKLKSKVWEDFTKYEGIDKKEWAKCKHCKKDFVGSSKSGTTHLKNHLKSCSSSKNPGRGVEKPKEKSVIDLKLNGYDLVLKIIKYGLNSIKNYILDVYKQEKDMLYRYLRKLPSRFNVTIENKSCLWFLTSWFIDDSWELKKMISLLGRYRDEDEVVYEIVKSWLVDWKIDKKLCSMVRVGYFDVFEREEVIKNINNLVNERGSLPFIGYFWPISLLLHEFECVINFHQLTRVSRNNISTKALKLFYYASMSSNVNKFQYTVKEALSMGKIVTSNSVTSYSRFDVDMLEWVMGCKEAFCELEHIDPDLKSINFMKDDWDEATLLYNSWKVLEDLRKEARNLLDPKHKTANVCFPMFCDIYLKLVQLGKSENHYYCHVASRFGKYFDQYWDKSNLILVITVILDPRFKTDIVKQFYKEIYGNDVDAYFKKIMDDVTNIYNKYAEGTNNSKSSSHSGHGASNSSITLSQKLHIIRTSSAFSQHVNDTATPESELDCYLRDSKCPSSEGFDILEWWRVNSPTYPILAKITRDFLSLPIYTPLSGLYFSLLHEIMDIYRCSNLDDDLKWPLACTKVWLNSSVIK